MKLNTFEKLYNCLRFEQPEIELATDLIEKAKMPIHKMLAIK